MKKIVLLGIVLGLAMKLGAQGIDFQKLSFSKALELAKVQNKMIFVDCYTAWCGPCKFMADSIFQQKETGDYFNRHFIAVKYDIEKAEAKEFNDLYAVASFPTFWFLSPQGEVVHRIVGASGSAKDWLKRVDNALIQGEKLEKLRRNYWKNKNEKNIQAYLEALKDIQFGEGICELFVDQFKEASDKIDFLYQYKNVFTKYLSLVHFEKFKKALKNCEGYIPEMDEIFEGVFY